MKGLYVVIGLVVIAALAWVLLQDTPTDESTGVAETGAETAAEHTGDETDHMEVESEAEAATQAETSDTETDTRLEAEADVDVAVDAEATEPMVFNITGQNFAFSDTEMRVPVGTTVTVNFTSTGGFHDWVVDEFGAATERVNAGGSSSVTFVADEAGTFEYYCSVGSHRAQGMVGTLIVE